MSHSPYVYVCVCVCVRVCECAAIRKATSAFGLFIFCYWPFSVADPVVDCDDMSDATGVVDLNYLCENKSAMIKTYEIPQLMNTFW